MKKLIRNIFTRLANIYNSRAERERKLIVFGSIALLLTFIWSASDSALNNLADKQYEIDRLTIKRDDIKQSLNHLNRLQSRLDKIEGEYERVGFKGGIRSHLERLIESELRLPEGSYEIKPSRAIDLGKSFQVIPYSIIFSTNELPSTVSFLKAISTGEKSLTVSNINLIKSRRNDKLKVTIGVKILEEKQEA